MGSLLPAGPLVAQPVEEPSPSRVAESSAVPGETTSTSDSNSAPAMKDEHASEHHEEGHWEEGEHHGERKPEIVLIAQDGRLAVEDLVESVVVIGGNFVLDGSVKRDVVVVAGTLKLNGEVGGSLTAVASRIEAGPKAVVKQETILVGGPLQADPSAKMGDSTVVAEFAGPLAGLGDWVREGAFMGRPLPLRVRWVWVASIFSLLLVLAASQLFPKPVALSIQALEVRPVASFFSGMVAVILLVPIIVLLVVSVVGILAVPILACGVLLALLFGKAAVYQFVGRNIFEKIGQSFSTGPAVMLLAGAALFYILYTVPVVGFLVYGLATVMALGAVMLALFGMSNKPAPVMASAPPAAEAVFQSTVGNSPAPVMATPFVEPISSTAPSSGTTEAGAPVPPTTEQMPGAVPSRYAGSPKIMSEQELLLLPRVGFWRRLCASFLDLLLLSIPMALAGPFFPFVLLAYFIPMWAWKGMTMGSTIMGLKLVRLNGEPMNLPVAIVRSLASFFSALVIGIGFFWAGWDREKQSWHDKIAGTVVVKMPRGTSLV
ncbi:MAG: RDD family protein [Verrucomicrobiota bacterium]|nr:RDD family protein [Verrucomicrobiota bacterium]